MAYQLDWSLHRKGMKDANRHRQKVLEAIKGNLRSIITEEAIVTSDGSRKVRVPIRALKEYYFRFGDFVGVGSGEGNEKKGDLIATVPKAGDGSAQAGNSPGSEYIEAEMSIEEIASLLFEEMGLPNLRPKAFDEIETEDYYYKEIRKYGPFQNINRRRTLLENVKRRAREGRPRVGSFKSEDLRFGSWERHVHQESNAAIIAIRDISSSMGEFEKYMSRTFFFWMLQFLRSKYNNVHVAFIVHHTEAREVDEESFFKLGESGGTRCSSAYNLALDVITNRFPPDKFNVYPFHFSDGDNWPDDLQNAVNAAKALLEVSNIFGYAEIKRLATELNVNKLSKAFEALGHDKRFVKVTMGKKEDVWEALRTFFVKSGDQPC